MATAEDRQRIYRIRYDVYALELGQHKRNSMGELSDALDEFNHYIVVYQGDELAGFVSITPPGHGRYSLDKYLRREEWPVTVDEGLFEVRLLTVVEHLRNKPIVAFLMHAVRRFAIENHATSLIAIGRREVIDIYSKIGFERHGRKFRSGEVEYELLSVRVADIESRTTQFKSLLERLESRVDWRLGFSYLCPSPTVQMPPTDERCRDTCSAAVCFHGGAFFETVGVGFDHLDRRQSIINADVLDAWFPPAPALMATLQEHLDWILRTSPPTNCQGLICEIAIARGVHKDCLVPAAGSSDILFRAILRWLKPGARVLMLDPTYGEYAHVFQHVVACQVDRLMLRSSDGFSVDLDELAERLRQQYDLCVLVNPNNPTGCHIPRAALQRVLQEAPSKTRFWIVEPRNHRKSVDSNVFALQKA